MGIITSQLAAPSQDVVPVPVKLGGVDAVISNDGR